MARELVDVDLVFLGETDLAIRVEDENDNSCWLPKSQIELERKPNTNVVTVTLPQWLAEEKELL